MTTADIRFATLEDAETVAKLIRDMDRHYRPDEELRPEADYRQMTEQTIANFEGTRFVVARDEEGRGVGLACVAVLRPGRDLQGLVYLKDLYVSEPARGCGLGTQIISFLSAYAVENDIGRMDFTTDTDNVGAQRLYDSLGGIRKEKVYYTLPIEALKAVAARANRAVERTYSVQD